MTIEPDDRRLWIRTLTWADVAPDRHPFDPVTLLDVVRTVAPAGGVPAPYRYDPTRGFDRATDDARWQWERAMTVALVEHYGSWACGWNAEMAGHTADGGLVLRWSGSRKSITTPEETLDAVARALLDWRTFLEDWPGSSRGTCRCPPSHARLSPPGRQRPRPWSRQWRRVPARTRTGTPSAPWL